VKERSRCAETVVETYLFALINCDIGLKIVINVLLKVQNPSEPLTLNVLTLQQHNDPLISKLMTI